jgi:multisubunit Na+/H+ antiporter MnhC subunit
MNFTLIERLQLVLALTLALTTTVVGMALAALVLGRLATSRQHGTLRRQPRPHSG